SAASRLENWMKTSKTLAVVAILFAAIVTTRSDSAQAAYTAEQQTCHAAMVKGALSVQKTALKAIVRCHKDRDAGKRPEAADCNSIATADLKNAVAAATTKLQGVVTSKCIGITPASIGYGNGCPSPCGNLPVATMTDVTDCMACLATKANEIHAEAVLGSSNPPLTDNERDCNAAVAKGYSKLENVILKSLYSCQKGDEKLGATDTLRCIYIDTPVADWTAAQNSLSSSVQDACTGAAYPNLDLCIAGPSS